MRLLRSCLVIGLVGCFWLSSPVFLLASSSFKKVPPVSRQILRPGDTLHIQLLSPLGTKENREGDHFTARVIEPEAFRDGFVEGHIGHIKRSGRVSGRAEMELTFETLTLPNDQEQKISAQVETLYQRETEVDSEGRVRSKSRQNKDILIVAGGTGIATAIGAAIGGRKGAAIGSAIGAAIGSTTVLATRGPDLDFPAGTEMTIRITQ